MVDRQYWLTTIPRLLPAIALISLNNPTPHLIRLHISTRLDLLSEPAGLIVALVLGEGDSKKLSADQAEQWTCATIKLPRLARWGSRCGDQFPFCVRHRDHRKRRRKRAFRNSPERPIRGRRQAFGGRTSTIAYGRPCGAADKRQAKLIIPPAGSR
jgi:hypothetical protein